MRDRLKDVRARCTFRRIAVFCLFSAGAASWGVPAQARGTFNAPAGQAPATAPGGTQGLAGPGNVEDAVRSGQAYGAQGAYGVVGSGYAPVRQRYDGTWPRPVR